MFVSLPTLYSCSSTQSRNCTTIHSQEEELSYLREALPGDLSTPFHRGSSEHFPRLLSESEKKRVTLHFSVL